MVIHQFLANGVSIYKIEIDNEVIMSEVISDPQAFDSVTLYASDPWHSTMDSRYGSLENLKAERITTTIVDNSPIG